ncbi:hypothetical protein [Ferviditalea candida]|uniref:Uncharacterized protein n=1 Tax=Ferviditalea candida TaxID=3108399 RepID=A0ABU5ZHV3_9BACL|nr:hypothetical protein [Paenibacillaceae bacterium T2]
METSMSPEEVLARLQQLQESGISLSKKNVKKTDPELMKNALYYFANWEHVMQRMDIETI